MYCRVKLYIPEDKSELHTRCCENLKSQTDNMFVMLQILEKAWEGNVEVQCLFIDFKAACDTIRRNGSI
jgi:hypothetical protein